MAVGAGFVVKMVIACNGLRQWLCAMVSVVVVGDRRTSLKGEDGLQRRMKRVMLT